MMNTFCMLLLSVMAVPLLGAELSNIDDKTYESFQVEAPGEVGDETILDYLSRTVRKERGKGHLTLVLEFRLGLLDLQRIEPFLRMKVSDFKRAQAEQSRGARFTFWTIFSELQTVGDLRIMKDPERVGVLVIIRRPGVELAPIPEER